ncbi:uncharacterized protein LOC128883934 [Hylaeus volcanicus]|uniref:uncharacterized protein LOC128883934 n=1 Tax=Hylaeus volcanicus TaxID=313075 RepID=UPI0023B800AF|nr:uncharacterized protein LOC128883934 [Hylaeus volcanicus]
MVSGDGVYRNTLVNSSRENYLIDVAKKKSISDLCETIGENKMNVKGKFSFNNNSLGSCFKKRTPNDVLNENEASCVLTTVANSLHRTHNRANVRSIKNPVECEINSHQQHSCTQFMRKQLRRTKLCPFTINGECIHRDKCTYAHSVEELRCVPDLRKTKLCESIEKGQVCKKEKCTYAHSYSELKIATGIGTYKTTLCFFWKKGRCMNRNKCRFAHGVDDLVKFPNDREENMNGHINSNDTENHTGALYVPHSRLVSDVISSYENTDATESKTKKSLQNTKIGVESPFLNADDSNGENVNEYNDPFNILKDSNRVMSDPNNVGQCSSTALKSLKTFYKTDNHGMNHTGKTFTDLPEDTNSSLYQKKNEYNVTEPIEWLLDLWSESEHDSIIQQTKTKNAKMSPPLAIHSPCNFTPKQTPCSETLSKSNGFPPFFTSSFSKNCSEIQPKKERISKPVDAKMSKNYLCQINFSKFFNPELEHEPYRHPCRNPCSLLDLPLHTINNDSIKSPIIKNDELLDQPWFSDLHFNHFKSEQNPFKITTKDSCVNISSLLPSVEAFTKLSEINTLIDEMYCKHDNSYYSKSF